jgi:hypothetical protein
VGKLKAEEGGASCPVCMGRLQKPYFVNAEELAWAGVRVYDV